MQQQHDPKRTTAGPREKTKRPTQPLADSTTGEVTEQFVAQTEFGRRLWTIRQRIVASGQPLLGWDGIEKELHERRGDRDTET